MLGISRGTLRTALRRLEETGEIVRRQGSGTFVGEVGRPAGFREGLEQLESYSSLARQRGVKLGAQDLEIETVALDHDLAERMGVAPGATATRVERVVVADGRPLALMVDTIHPDVPLPPEGRLRRAINRGEMVLDVLLAEGVPIAYSETSIQTRVRASLRTRMYRRGPDPGITHLVPRLGPSLQIAPSARTVVEAPSGAVLDQKVRHRYSVLSRP